PPARAQEHPHGADRVRGVHVHVRAHVPGRRGVRLVSAPERGVPPVGEQIHLSPPTSLPVLTAIGVTLALVGVTTYIVLTFAGGLLALGCVIAWIREQPREVDELPLD